MATPAPSATASNTMPDLLSCSPAALATWLLQHRFNKNAALASSFGEHLTTALKESVSSSQYKLPDESLRVFHQPSSAIIPRLKKVNLSCYRDKGVVVRSEDQDTVLTYADSVQHVVFFPPRQAANSSSSSSSNNTTATHVLLVPSKPIHWLKRKKPVPVLCLATTVAAVTAKKAKDEDGNDDDEPARIPPPRLQASVLAQAFPEAVIHDAAKESQFTSYVDTSMRTTDAGKLYIACHCGVQDGSLYPLPTGLLFVGTSSARFVPVDQIATLECGGTSTRYAQVQVVLKKDDDDDDNKSDKSRGSSESEEEEGGEVIVFDNIHATELQGLQDYCTTLIGRDGDDDDDDESEDDSDEEIIIGEAGSNVGTPSRRRKASVQAQAANKRVCRAAPDFDDDAGDENFDEEEESETDDEDDEVGDEEVDVVSDNEEY